MKIEGLSTKALDFIEQNADLPMIGEGVLFHFVDDGRIRMMLEITENTTMAQIQKDAYLIKDWQERLLVYQGPNTVRNYMLDQLSELKRAGWSWARIARLYPFSDARDWRQVRDRIRAWRKSRKSKLSKGG